MLSPNWLMDILESLNLNVGPIIGHVIYPNKTILRHIFPGIVKDNLGNRIKRII